ncbi:MAG TPA: hypothetical protein VGI43_11465 [Mucilaginibacter sp.]|jgi:hypothetical protein
MNADEQQFYNSESTLEISKPAPKIYKTKPIQVATFLGGPLVAGYLIAENFKAFNERQNARKTWLYTIIATVLICSTIFLIPDTVKIPDVVFPIIYSWITYYIVKHYQGAQIDASINEGVQIYSWWRVVGIGLLGCAITVAILLILISFANI